MKLKKLFGYQLDIPIFMIGPHGSGKRQLASVLKNACPEQNEPTVGFSVEIARYRDFSMVYFDIEGMDQKLRPLFRGYFENACGVVFVFDAATPEGLEGGRYWLEKLSQVPELQGKPILVLANRRDPVSIGVNATDAQEPHVSEMTTTESTVTSDQDLPREEAGLRELSMEEIAIRIKLHTALQGRRSLMLECNSATGQGVFEAMDWLAAVVQRR